MSSVILTEDCMFVCSYSMPAPIPKKLQILENNMVYFDNGRQVLTENCKLVGNFGSCLLLPDPVKQTPTGGQCTFCSQQWREAYEGFRIKGVKVLSNKSSMQCPIGGIISPVIFNIKTSIDNIIADEAIILERGCAEHKVESKASRTVDNKGNKSKVKEDVIDASSDEEKKENIKKTDELDTSSIEYKYVLCDYKSCPDRDSCEYIKARYDADSIDNDAVKLERNYKNRYSMEYQQFIDKQNEKNNESTEGNWIYAAHHIISGKQILAKHPYLVKLANYYNYDINTAENCALLPSIHSFYGKTGVAKQANGYVAMDLMKMQWHVGHHDYSLDNDTVIAVNQYLKKIEKCHVMFYRNYVEAVEHEINVLESKYMRLSCRKNDYQNKSNRFIQNMNAVSHTIINRIKAFEIAYKQSYPYYVSKEACMFAFNVPKKKKFIIVYKQEKYKKSSYIAVALTVTRYKKDDYKILFTANDPYIISDSDTKSFIMFADNIKYFIILTPDFKLPWKVDRAREYVLFDTINSNDISLYCDENKQKIVSFVEARDGGEMYYESATKIVKQRITDMESVKIE